MGPDPPSGLLRLVCHRRSTVRTGSLAADTLVHGLTVVTRNVQDFDDTGVIVVDP